MRTVNAQTMLIPGLRDSAPCGDIGKINRVLRRGARKIFHRARLVGAGERKKLGAKRRRKPSWNGNSVFFRKHGDALDGRRHRDGCGRFLRQNRTKIPSPG